jgi:hypothetical protein
MSYFKYNCWGITHTPRDCVGSARVFETWGLDRFLTGLAMGQVYGDDRLIECRRKKQKCGGLSAAPVTMRL